MTASRTTLALLFPLVLTACSTTTERETFVLSPPASLMQTCPKLSEWNYQDNMALIMSELDIIDRYKNCAAIHNNLVDWITQIKETKEFK